MIGGVTTDLAGRTSLPGLWAVGEVAATGVHGANRLGSNSLVEGLVFGERAARDLHAPRAGGPKLAAAAATVPLAGEGRTGEVELFEEIRDRLWEEVGIVREADGLRRALARFEEIGRGTEPDRPDALASPVANAALTASLVARAALARTESRGAHSRSDYPKAKTTWQRHLAWRRAPIRARTR